MSDVGYDWKFALKVQLGGKWSRREVWGGGGLFSDGHRRGG